MVDGLNVDGLNVDGLNEDRVLGVLRGLAAGDALGAGYEFKPAFSAQEPVGMIGGGLGDFAPGEWTDDTSMAVVIARALAAAQGHFTEQAADAMVRDWYLWAQTAPDVGAQTSAVLRMAHQLAGEARDEQPDSLPGALHARRAAEQVHQRTGRSGGNGSLMRTAPVALATLRRPARDTFEMALAVSALTHFDPEAGEACGLWSVAIRHAVLTGELDVRAGLGLLDAPRAALWEERIAAAEAAQTRDFAQNGWVVQAFQSAWCAIATTRTPGPAGHLVAALETAVRGGQDTDTVAAIAGSLIGAALGSCAIPARWQQMLQGWPGLAADDLDRLALKLAAGR